MSETFYREDCERDFAAVAIQETSRDLVGFRAQCHPLASFDYEALQGWLTVYCQECYQLVMRFRSTQYLSPKTLSCTCKPETDLVEAAYRDGMLVLFCAKCHLPVLAAEIAPHSIDFPPAPEPQEAAPRWVN
jgi:hypothetical protein